MSSFSPSELLVKKAQAALDVGRPKEAVPLLLHALDDCGMGKEGADVMCHLAQAFFRQNDNKEALVWADRAVAAAPDNEWAHRLRACALENLKRVSEAISALNTARQLAPELPCAYRMLSRLYLNKSDYEQAEKNAMKAIELAPEDTEVFHDLAQLALRKAKKEKGERRGAFLFEAEKRLRDGLALDAQSPYLLSLRGELLMAQNRPAEAFLQYVETARQFPQNTYALSNVRCALYRLLIGELPKPSRRHIWICALCTLIQGTGFFLHWGAWPAFAPTFALSFAVEFFVMAFPDRAIRSYPLFRQATPQLQTALNQAAILQRNYWRKGGAFIAAPAAIAFFLSGSALLLRGLWNAGVWIFHAVGVKHL